MADAAVALSEQDVRALGRLARSLDAAGLPEVIAQAPEAAPGPAAWAAAVDTLDGPPRAAADLLLMGRTVPARLLSPELRSCLPVLAAAGLARVGTESVEPGGAVLMRPAGVWMFAAPPSPFETDWYFGADSVELARRTPVVAGTRLLDLCTGTGLQALRAAVRGARVDATEIRSAAVAVAAVNAALNHVADRVALFTGDLFGPLRTGARYDHVVANVPFLPGRALGRDGFRLGRRILEGLPDHLAPAGRADLTCLVFTGPDRVVPPAGLAEFAAATGRDVAVGLGARWSLDTAAPLVETLAEELAPDRFDFCAERIARLFVRRELTAARSAHVRVGAAAGSGRLRVHEEGSAADRTGVRP
ncbi:methyltransferase [Streptomyces sp. NPDC091267]|uniref:methyltransferase n=1 Tax=Streptomyces sp. NPDC091267 TaxID=3155195 RepID=UPI00342061D5